MVTRDVLEDIEDYDPKIIGSFSTRQLICSALAVLVGGTTYLFLYFVCNLIWQICAFCAGIMLVPFIVCGWKKIYGIPFEKFALSIIKLSFGSPKNRVYRPHNVYEDLIEKEKPLTKKELKEFKTKRLQDEKELGEEGMPIK